MIKHLFCTLLITSLSLAAVAQGRVSVSMDAAAASAINAARSQSKVSGYRVCIFSDNSQSGRAAANTAVAQLRSIVGDVPSEVIYENPFFRAYAGQCLNRIEATRLLGRLRAAFPRAIIVGESFPVSLFSAKYDDAESDEEQDQKTDKAPSDQNANKMSLDLNQ